MKPYFSHDEGARNDPKLVRVLMRLGQAGKGVYWDLVEMLHEQGGYLPLGDLESMAFGLRTDLPTLTSLLNDFGLFSQDAERFWSETALTRLQMRNAKAEARAAAGAKGGKAKAEKLAMLQQTSSIASEEPSNARALPAETLARKEKKRKEKETKEPLPSVEDAASAAAPTPVEVEEEKLLPESPQPELRTPGGAADVGTLVVLTKQRGGKWQAPGLAEVVAYFREKRPRNPGCWQNEAERFVDYYTSNGWKVGRSAMQDWQAAVRNWLKKVPEVGPAYATPATNYNGAIGQRPSQVSTRAAAIAGADAMFDAVAAGQDPFANKFP